jgi:hypothetical protein
MIDSLVNSFINSFADTAANKLIFEKAICCLQNEVVETCEDLIDKICYVVIQHDSVTVYGIYDQYIITAIKKCIKERNWHSLEKDVYRIILESYFFVYKKIKIDEANRTLVGFILHRNDELEMKLLRMQSSYIQKKVVQSKDIKTFSLINAISL